MSMGTMADLSPYKVFTAAETLGGAFTAVGLNSVGAVTAGESIAPVGILAAETFTLVEAGEDVNVQIYGGTQWLTGASIQAGEYLTAGEGGKAYKATSGKYIFAQALENAAEGDAVHAQIIHGGVKG